MFVKEDKLIIVFAKVWATSVYSPINALICKGIFFFLVNILRFLPWISVPNNHLEPSFPLNISSTAKSTFFSTSASENPGFSLFIWPLK